MSQKHTLNSFALAVVLAGAIFVVAFMLFMFIADYRVIASLFLALLVALLAGIVLFLGFGTPSEQALPAAARAPADTSSDTAPPAAAAPVAAAAADTAASEQQAAAQAEVARLKAEEEAAAETMRARQEAAEAEAAAKAAAEAEAAEAEAARVKAEAEAAEAARAKAAEESAAAEAAAAAATPAADHGIPDYDGDGKLEGTEEGTRPAGLDAPRDGKADDLKQIKGIGPKLEKLCNSLGFWHFDQVAAWSSDEVAWVDANLEGIKGRVTRDKWVEQAGVLASGGETEFSKRVEDGDVY